MKKSNKQESLYGKRLEKTIQIYDTGSSLNLISTIDPDFIDQKVINNIIVEF